MITHPTPSRKAQAFGLAFLIALVLFLPFLIQDRGYFLYYGDFNVQQIPFYQLAHEAVRSGDVLWNWNTDLGVNFIGSYGFYLLFSPFFWVTLPFPTWFVPYLMAPLLMLKFACASLTAYLYLERFVKNRAYAVIGGLLYSFSGWMLFNVFFNHFLEVAVFFPLLLLAVEKLVTEDKKLFFAAMVAVNAMVNYWFFVGEAIFVILYVLMRMTDKRWGMTFKKFLITALEAVLGVAAAAVVLLPCIMALMGNPRTGTSEMLTGWNFWIYWNTQRLPAILNSFFFPPELPARPNFFSGHDAKWASMSGWLPVIGVSGGIAYFLGRKNDWAKKLLGTCLVFALIPGLNSIFILFNHSYYARWFYMPMLILAMASIRVLEEMPQSSANFARALKWVACITGVFAAAVAFTPNRVGGKIKFGMAAFPQMMWAYIGFAAVALVLCRVVVIGLRRHKAYLRFVSASVALFTVVFGIFYMANGKTNSAESAYFITEKAIRGREQISLPEEPFARTDVFEGMDNLAMFWHLPTIQAFHSVVPPSIMDFYPEVGVTRDVGSRPGAEPFALRALLSVRWLFINENGYNQEPMPGFALYDNQNGHNIYENNNYLPMGFGYDKYITRRELQLNAEYVRSNVLLSAVVLDEEGIERNWERMGHADTNDEDFFYNAVTLNNVNDRRALAAYSFRIDKTGFTSLSNLDKGTLMFYSVPWEQGWAAYIDNEPVQIERANIGFMAVWVPAGEHVIRFEYTVPGLYMGAVISAGAVILLLLYWLLCRRMRRKAAQNTRALPSDWNKQEGFMSWDEYLQRQKHRSARRAHLQRALNEASRLHINETIGDDEKTMRFVVDFQNGQSWEDIPQNDGGEDEILPDGQEGNEFGG